MSIEEKTLMLGYTKNIPTGKWTEPLISSYDAMVTATKAVKVINIPQQIYDQTDLIQSIKKLELAIVELNDKIEIVIANTKESSSTKEELTLKNISVEDTVKEIKRYLKDNDAKVTISELMTSLLIEPSIISIAVDELINSGDIKEI